MAGFDPPGRLVTLTDVAREAGVGESTVSRVLRNHGSYSKRAASGWRRPWPASATCRTGWRGASPGAGRARGRASSGW